MASYKAAVEWIATEDEAAEDDVNVIARLISVCLVADLWAKPRKKVAHDVLAYRVKRSRQLPR